MQENECRAKWAQWVESETAIYMLLPNLVLYEEGGSNFLQCVVDEKSRVCVRITDFWTQKVLWTQIALLGYKYNTYKTHRTRSTNSTTYHGDQFRETTTWAKLDALGWRSSRTVCVRIPKETGDEILRNRSLVRYKYATVG